MQGESEVQGESVECFKIYRRTESLTSPGTKDVDKDDDLLPKVLGDDHKCRSVCYGASAEVE